MRQKTLIHGVTIGVLLVTAACSQQPARERIRATAPPGQRIDFSGSWEMDYARSDDIRQKLTEVFRQINRNAGTTPAAGNARSRPVAGVTGATGLVDLARLADLITRPEILEIEQDKFSIVVERENDFALTCDFHSVAGQRVESPFGYERCGWDGRQMVFHLTLPDGVVIVHRMTLAPDRQNLHIATTVSSPRASMPFTMSRFFARFEPLPTSYRCEHTFSRKTVCHARPPKR